MSNTFIVTARWPQRRRCEARCGSSAGASPEPRQSFAGVHVREPRRGFAGASPEPRWSAFPGASPEPRQSLAGVHVREPHWGLAGASPELRWSACPPLDSRAGASLECMSLELRWRASLECMSATGVRSLECMSAPLGASPELRRFQPSAWLRRAMEARRLDRRLCVWRPEEVFFQEPRCFQESRSSKSAVLQSRSSSRR